jgi:hypothetical protein
MLEGAGGEVQGFEDGRAREAAELLAAVEACLIPHHETFSTTIHPSYSSTKDDLTPLSISLTLSGVHSGKNKVVSLVNEHIVNCNTHKAYTESF